MHLLPIALDLAIDTSWAAILSGHIEGASKDDGDLGDKVCGGRFDLLVSHLERLSDRPYAC